MFQYLRDKGGIEPGHAFLVTGRTVYGSDGGQGISGGFLEIFDGMDGILACLVDMTGTAIHCAVMSLLRRMAVLAERGDIT
jgi:hypothetical protein